MTEPVRVQIQMRILTREGQRALDKFGRQRIIFDWSATGATPSGIEITSVIWDNYKRHHKRSATDAESIEQARASLHLAELFSEQPPVSRKMRDSETIRQPIPALAGRGQKEPTRRARKARKNRAAPRSKKSRKHRAHTAANNRMDSNRKKQRRKGVSRRSKNKRST